MGVEGYSNQGKSGKSGDKIRGKHTQFGTEISKLSPEIPEILYGVPLFVSSVSAVRWSWAIPYYVSESTAAAA
jgi:hypothetical protein